ncbi:MAG TPA: hypothetical protein PLT65_00040 [Bacilli bacterium]|nr:hypothetical protein [Bacilli bacterium]
MISKRSNIICQVASLLLSLTAITIITYITITYIMVRKYEEKLWISIAGNDVISIYNVVGIRKIESIDNKYNKNVTIIYKYVTSKDIDNYMLSLLAEKYIIVEDNEFSKSLEKENNQDTIVVKINKKDGIYIIMYYIK